MNKNASNFPICMLTAYFLKKTFIGMLPANIEFYAYFVIDLVKINSHNAES